MPRTAKILIFLISFSSFAGANSLKDLTGHYRCVGEDFLNKTTFDEPTELTKTGDTYFFKWINKGQEFNGTAVFNEGTLSAIFWAKAIEAIPGVVTYKVLPNGDLKGKWTIKQSHQSGVEYCKKVG